MYYRESFEYSPIKMFFNSNAADTITNRGNVTFNLRRNINLPNNVIGYVSLNELTIPNTNFNINSSNNSLVLLDRSLVPETFTITPGNYTVSQLKDALNTAFSVASTPSYQGITVSYNDITNKYLFTDTESPFLVIQATSTMNSVLGFESGRITNSVFVNPQGSELDSDNSFAINTTFTVTALNNTLRVAFLSYAAVSITLTPGNGRTGAQIAADLNVQLTNAALHIVAAYNATSRIFTFTNSTTDDPFFFYSTGSTALALLGFNNVDRGSTITGTHCTLTSDKIIDLSGNNSFYVTTNLGVANYLFLNSNFTGGANVLAKVQLTTANTGIEFYNNLTAFKTRFYDTNVTQIHIVLYDEDFNPWVPLSDWSCVLEMTFYEKYDLTTKLKSNNLLFSS